MTAEFEGKNMFNGAIGQNGLIQLGKIGLVFSLYLYDNSGTHTWFGALALRGRFTFDTLLI